MTARRSGALTIFSLLAENENLRAELRALRDENEELRLLAFGEFEYFRQLTQHWSRHIQPRGYSRSARRR